MIKVLITGVGGDIGSTVAKCIRHEYRSNAVIYGCDIDPVNQGIIYVDEFFEVPRATDEDYVPLLISLCENYDIDILIPITEPEIERISKSWDLFAGLHTKLMINDASVLSAFEGKMSTAKALTEIDIAAPLTYQSIDPLIKKGVDFPIIVKEDVGCGSRSVRIALTQHEAIEVAESMQNPIFQEYIGSEEEEYTVGVFSDGDQTFSIAFRRKLGYGGMTVKAFHVEDDEISNIAKSIAHAFGLRGSINVQLRKQDGKYYVFEINSRLSSTVGLRYKAGFKDCIWWIDLLLNGPSEIEYEPLGEFVGVKTLDDVMLMRSSDESLVNVIPAR